MNPILGPKDLVIVSTVHIFCNIGQNKQKIILMHYSLCTLYKSTAGLSFDTNRKLTLSALHTRVSQTNTLS